MSHAALLEVAELLRPEGSAFRGEPRVGWPALLDTADEHALLPALWSALVAAGVRPLPTDLRARAPRAPLAVLEDAYLANAARVDDLRAQGVGLLRALHAEGVTALPLKGLHGLLAEWWRDPAARVMVDVDLLVEPARIDDAVEIATALGYRDLGTSDPEQLAAHQHPALGLDGHLGSVELHTSPVVLRRAAVLPVPDLFAAAHESSTGAALPVPSPTHAVVLTIAHAQLQDDGARLLHVPLRALYDVASMHATGALTDVDWDEVRRRLAQVRAGTALAGFAVALAQEFAVELPVPRRGGAEWWRAACWADDHRGAAQRYRELVSLPRALSADRMRRLHGARTGGDVWRARVRHVAAGARRRLVR